MVHEFTPGRQVLNLWSRGQRHEVTTAPLEAPLQLILARLSEGGHVAAVQVRFPVTPGCLAASFLWHRGIRTELGPLTVYEVNRQGQVIGSLCEDGGPDSQVLWDDGEITRAPSFEGGYTRLLALNDQGQIVGAGTPADSFSPHSVLWDDGQLTDIGTGTGSGYNLAPAINERGQVLIQSLAETGRQALWLWDRGELIALPAQVPEPDDPADIGDVGAILLNDRGQVVGLRTGSPDAPPETVGPALWEVRRPR